MSEEMILKFFADYIEKQLGIVYSEANYFQLSHRLHDISQQLGLKNLQELHKKASASIEGNFKSMLLDLATNNETSFYRDSHIFKSLGTLILPEILSRPYPPTTINIWSSAVSSGQEIYSIAMELDTFSKQNPKSPNFTLLASDISDIILKRAKEGIYSQLEIQRGLPTKSLLEYFDQIDGNQWRVKDHIKRNITFKKINLLDQWLDIDTFDIIFCRNVLIYQNIENKKLVVNQFAKVLKPEGYLIMGAAESLFGISDQFSQITSDKVIIYKKKH